MISSSDTWSTSITASSVLPPPPPPPSSSSWDFWDPFVPPPPRSEEEWEDKTVAVTATGTAASVTAPLSFMSSSVSGSELAMVVSRNSKDLIEIVKEVDEYFLKAADGGFQLSLLLEVPNPNFSSQNKGGKVYDHGCNLTNPSLWTWNSSLKMNGFGKMSEGNDGVVGVSHCSTVERLYPWEKKLFQEVKEA